MITYTYIVKCPHCEDEFFDFFDEAKEFAIGRLTNKPIITQTEVNRNDFGECTDHCDLGTVWSWEDVMKETDAEPTVSVFTKDDLKCMANGQDPEFDNLDNSVDVEITENLEHIQYCPSCGAMSDYSDSQDNGSWVRYTCRACDNTWDIDKPRKPITDTESYATKEFEIPNFDAEIIDEFEDEGIKGYNIVYSKNGTDIVEVEVWETDSPVAVNRNLHTPNLMQGYYSSFDAFASDLEYKTSKYVRVRESADRKPIPEDSNWNPKTPGYYGEEIFKMLDKLSNERVYDFLNEYGWYDTFGATADGIRDIYTSITDWLDRNSGYALYSDLGKYFYHNNLDEACERKPIPEGMTIKELVEAMEENEDTVECTWCEDLFDKSECRYEVDLGWLCSRCEMAIKSRGETLTFKENNYWDFLDEDLDLEIIDEEDKKEETLEEAIIDQNDRGGFADISDGLIWLARHVNKLRNVFAGNTYYTTKAFPKYTKSTEAGRTRNSKYSPGAKYTYTTTLIVAITKNTLNTLKQAVDSGVKSFNKDVKAFFYKKAANDFVSDAIDKAFKSIELTTDIKEISSSSIDENFTGVPYEITFTLTVTLSDNLGKNDVNYKSQREALDADTYELATLVQDSINHLINDLGKDPWAEDFTDEVVGDLERNYETYVPEDFAKYQEWCSEVACEVSRQVNSQYPLDEKLEPKTVHDLGNEYDGAYPTDKPDLPEPNEISEVSDFHLSLCPECGEETFDRETGICVTCGFN